MTIDKIIEITDNNNPASVMHDDPRAALAQVHALALGIASVDVAGKNEPSALLAEIHRLRAELAGPDGFVTWKDAAIAERRRRVEFESSAQDEQVRKLRAERDALLRQLDQIIEG